jgi:tRNA-modifying protein YgfZ
MTSGFSELRGADLIAVRGEDAIAFLHAQLTSDVAALPPLQTQYSGYCTPKGRVRATFLLWHTHEELMLQLPESLRAELQTTLSRYVLRSRVQLSAATDALRLFGVWGGDAPDVLRQICGDVPGAAHEVVITEATRVARVPLDRFIVAATADRAEDVRAALRSRMAEEPEVAWSRHEIEAGIPVVLRESQDRYVPQMLNLDLVGAVSYTKGCYPGQEIVARMHYLGRLKERMYRIHVPGPGAPVVGDALYGGDFGPEQACGGVLCAAPSGDGYDALAVIQTSSARSGALHWKSLDGPAVQLKPLPYTVPD